MNDLDNIVNLKKHPIINSEKYLYQCKNAIKSNSILKLDNFLTKNAINSLQKEAKLLHKKAFYCNQNHTILLNKKNKNISENDPCNILVKSDKGCVPHDIIPKISILNNLYKSNYFINFITKILNVKKIFPYKDSLSSINYNYYEKDQQLGWHFDNATFAITLMIFSPDLGGEFQYINKGRDFEKNFIDKKFINKVMSEEIKAKEIAVKPGTLLLFYGRNYLHRVKPIKSKKGRVLVTLNYNLEKDVELSENARKTFFGRKI